MPFGFTMFTKPRRYDAIMYDDILQPYYDDSFLVESWGRPYMNSICNLSKNKVSNIVRMKYEEYEWKDTDD